jgi:hypothetical protein
LTLSSEAPSESEQSDTQSAEGEARERETEDDPSRRTTAPLGTDSQRGEVEVAVRERIGRYEIRAELGRGGVGVVYDAWDPKLGREVALKTLIAGRDASAVQIERFLREVRACAKLRHPHIVSVHDAGVIDGCFYLAMDVIRGASLANLLDTNTPLTPRQAVKFLLPIARALQHAHEQGFLHRDVKPENILVDGDGEAYLTDFGLAIDLAETERLTRTNQSLGTPAFMAPEQLRGNHREPRMDVYGLGATLFECLAGRLPFQGESFPELMHQILHHEVPSPRDYCPRLAPDLEAVVLTCLEKEPERRYATPGALADDLDRFLAGEAVHARAPSALRKLGRRLARHRALAFGLGVALLGLAAGGAVALNIRVDVNRELDRARHLEDERGRLLLAQQASNAREAEEQDRRAAFARASLAPTLSSQVAAYGQLLRRHPGAWEARVARARLLRTLCHQRRASKRDLAGAREAAQLALEDVEQALVAAANPALLRLFKAELLRTEVKDAHAARLAYQALSRSLEGASGPRDDSLRAYAAGRLALERQPKEATRLARRSLASSYELPSARLLLAEALLAEGDAEQALQAVGKVAGGQLLESEFLLLRGEALRRQGSLQGAAGDAGRALELDPSDFRGHLLLARVRLDQGHPKGALPHLVDSRRLAPHDAHVLLAFAVATLQTTRDLARGMEFVLAARRNLTLSDRDPLLGEAQRQILRLSAELDRKLTAKERAGLGLLD